MSSKPFRLPIPVVDEIPTESGNYVVRSKNPDDFADKMQVLLDKLTTKDVVKGYVIGYRPDHPIPNARWFIEVSVRIGEAENWLIPLNSHLLDLYHFSVTGSRCKGKYYSMGGR